MSFYRNAIAIGAIACLYLMMKLIKNKIQEASGDSSPPKEPDKSEKEELIQSEQQESTEKTVEATNSKRHINVQEEVANTRAMKLLRPRPNFFLAVQVNDAGIHEKIKKLQENVISKNRLLKAAIVSVSTLHVTLAVTHLSQNTDIENLKKKLDEWAARNIKTYFDSPCVLSFKGVKTFKNMVAYVDVMESPSVSKLSELSKEMNNLISSAGYFTTEKKVFVPHLTFLKLSKDIRLCKKKKQFNEDFESLKKCDEFFGEQEIHHLQLLSMDEPKDENGYYKCFHKIDF